MDEPLVYLNGRLVPQTDASIALHDVGFVQGATVTEQLRTFSGQLFRLEDHLDRLFRSLVIVGIRIEFSREEVAQSARQLVESNSANAAADDELGLCIFVTPGSYPALNMGDAGQPCLCMHTYPLPWRLWADKYRCGQSLVVTPVRQIPQECWPAELKCRSRMHYWLADQAAAARDPGAKALLLDQQDYVLETTSANILVCYEDEGILVPPHDKVLPGISLAVSLELADQLEFRHAERDLTCDDVARAEEVLLTSTPYCLLPVSRFDGAAIADGKPGKVFQRMIGAWSDLVGVDIIAQAEQQVAR